MQPTLAVAALLEGGAGLLAALAAAAVLLSVDPRRRATAMVVALGLAAAGLATLVTGSIAGDLRANAGLAAAGAAAGAVVIAALAVLLYRHPGAIVPAVFVALPVRIPVPIGSETANLLLLLYAVIAAAVVAEVARAVRTPVDRLAEEPPPRDRRLRRLEIALVAVVVVYAAQSLYSTDAEPALKNLCFFYVPFAVLFRLLADLEWTRRRVVTALGVSAGLAVVFAGVGLVEYATKHLLIFNSKVLTANEIKPYFRVNSLFFDPNIYGRFLALTTVALAGTLLWRRRERDVALIAAAVVLLWAGLVVSLSESSFASLLAGLVVLVAVRWRLAPVLAVVAAGAVAAGALLAFAPGTLGLKTDSFDSLNRTTSGRAALVREGLRMARDRPVLGYGSGSFAERYRARRRLLSKRSPAESHTIPVTVAAEQGLVGLAAYGFLVFAAFSLLFSGLRAAGRRGPPGFPDGARMVVAAVFSALFLHTLVYAAFLEDPLTWTLLGLGAALACAPSTRLAATVRSRAAVPAAA